MVELFYQSCNELCDVFKQKKLDKNDIVERMNNAMDYNNNIFWSFCAV